MYTVQFTSIQDDTCSTYPHTRGQERALTFLYNTINEQMESQAGLTKFAGCREHVTFGRDLNLKNLMTSSHSGLKAF